MAAAAWFWIIFVIIGIFGGFFGFTMVENRRYLGGGFVVYILIGLLGWGVFGSPLK